MLTLGQQDVTVGMHRRHTLLAAVLPVAMAVAAPVCALADQSPQIPTERTTEVDLIAQVLYNSNSAGSDRQTAVLRGLKLEDESFRPSLDFVFARALGPTMVFVRGGGGYDVNRVNTIRNGGNANVAGGAAAQFGYCKPSVVGDYILSQSDINELSRGIINNYRDQEDVTVSAKCGRSIGLAPSASFTQSWAQNSAVLDKQINVQSQTVTAALGYRRPVFGVLSVTGTFQQANYPNRTVAIGSGLGSYGYTLYAGGVSYEHVVGARIDVLASVSYSSLRPNANGATGFNGVTYSADVTYHATPRIDAHAGASRATVPSNRPDANFSINTTYTADVSYHLNSRIMLKVGGDRRGFDYQDTLPLALQTDLTRQTIYDAMGSVTWQANRRISFSFNAGDQEVSANFPGLSYSATTVSLTSTAKF